MYINNFAMEHEVSSLFYLRNTFEKMGEIWLSMVAKVNSSNKKMVLLKKDPLKILFS